MGLISYMEHKINVLICIKDQCGLIKFLIGRLKVPYYRYLQRKYGFDKWHTTPYELRPYALRIVEYITTQSRERGGIHTICEVGCGIGDILRNIKAEEKIGVDISDKVIWCAADLDKKTNYYTGGFDKLCEVAPKDIDILITVNFIHNIEPFQLAYYYKTVLEKRNVKTVIADTVDAKGYRYKHDFQYLLPGYGLERCIFDRNGRKVLVLKRKA